MQVDRRVIESSLPSKGFVREDDDHRYFYHEYEGERTGVCTYTSHGSKYKTYGAELLGMMKKQLRLDSIRQVVDLFECPTSGEDYNLILKEKGLL